MGHLKTCSRKPIGNSTAGKAIDLTSESSEKSAIPKKKKEKTSVQNENNPKKSKHSENLPVVSRFFDIKVRYR